jgi:hypothetical protein
MSLNDSDLHATSLEIIEYVRSRVEMIRKGQVPFHELVETRQLTKERYADENLAHVQVAKKIEQRTGKAPALGTRISFIYTTGHSKIKAYEAAELPEYILQKGLVPDYQRMIEKLRKQIVAIFDIIIKGGESPEPGVAPLGNPPVHFKQDPYERMFGETNHVTRKCLLEIDPIYGFTTQRYYCRVCNAPSTTIICRKCQSYDAFDQVESKLNTKISIVSAALERANSVCRGCLSIETNDIHCSNEKCKSYFPRVGQFYALKKLEQESQQLADERATIIDIEDLF